MEPNAFPTDPVATAALVVRVIDDIDTRDDEDEVSLLSALMCAAWGSIRAQNQ